MCDMCWNCVLIVVVVLELYIQIKVDFLGICGNYCVLMGICIMMYKYVGVGIVGSRYINCKFSIIMWLLCIGNNWMMGRARGMMLVYKNKLL